MRFKTYLRIVQAGEFVIYFAIASLLLFVIFPLFDMPVFADVVFAMFGVAGAFAVVFQLRNKYVFNNTVKRSMEFYNTLDTSVIEGISDYYLRKAKISQNAVTLANNVFMSYATHDYMNDTPFEYIQNILDIEQAYDDLFYLRVIQIREIIMFRLIQHAQIEEALKLAMKQLDYIERMIDEHQVPEAMEENILNTSSTYRHLIRFINSPNVRTAFAIKVAQNATNYDKVKTYYMITRVFLENDMEEEAKIACQKALDIKGDYRLLERLKEYRESL